MLRITKEAARHAGTKVHFSWEGWKGRFEERLGKKYQ